MTQSNSDRAIRSALFVDFDNIYTRLSEQDEAAAELFARQPLQWISWLEESLPSYGQSEEPTRRRILVRRCYLNPGAFGRYRPYFIKSAFETVDCPALTTRGKTSADVHMVLDVLELLDHEVKFDEFIIMSADADFTPVLLKLRKWDRRTVVLAVGSSSPAYRSASDLVIDQDAFLAEALASTTEEYTPSPAVGKRDARLLTEQNRKEYSKLVQEYVGSASAPVAMAVLASRIRRSHPHISTDWLGFGSFKLFLEALDLGKLDTSSVIPGYVYDPKRHAQPTGVESLGRSAEFAGEASELSETAKRVHDLTDTPFLTPAHYCKLYDTIANEINDNGYHFTSVSKNVRDKCKEMDVPVGRQQVNFVLRGISFAGHRFGVSKESPQNLAARLYRNTLYLCENAQLTLTDHEKALVKKWLMHDFPDTSEQNAASDA